MQLSRENHNKKKCIQNFESRTIKRQGNTIQNKETPCSSDFLKLPQNEDVDYAVLPGVLMISTQLAFEFFAL